MNTNGIANYSVGGAAPLNRTDNAPRPRETPPDEPQTSSPPPRASTVVQISPEARELARAADDEQNTRRADAPQG